MDFIKDSAVKTVNGIKTEFAKTANVNGKTAMQQISMPKRNPTKTDSKRKRQNGAKTESCQNGIKTESKRCKTETVETATENGKTAKRSKRKRLKRKLKTAKRTVSKTVNFETENGEIVSFENGNGNGQNGQFWSTKHRVLCRAPSSL